MPQQAAIVLTDAATTPVNHTFNPNGALQQPDRKVVAEWVAKSTYSVGDQILREQFTPANGNGFIKQRFVLERPVLEQAAGVSGSGFTPPPTLAYKNWVEVTFHTHSRSTAQERKDLATMAADLVSEAVTKSKIENNERSW